MLRWEGKKVIDRLRRAESRGVNETMAAAVVAAKRNHPWRNRTGTLEGSIDIHVFARAGRGGVRGVWGSRDVRYALIQELGGVIRPRRARALVFMVDGQFVTVQKVTIPPRPYLRPAADAAYPGLAGRIRAAFKRAA